VDSSGAADRTNGDRANGRRLAAGGWRLAAGGWRAYQRELSVPVFARMGDAHAGEVVAGFFVGGL